MGAQKADPVSPLGYLSKVLRRGPPSISALVGMIGSLEDYSDFVALVKEYLPDYEAQILREPTPYGQIAIFAGHFKDRYFPLHPYLEDGEVEGYGELTCRIPANVYGISYEEHYAPEDFGVGYALMIYLTADEVSIPLTEVCRQHLSPSALESAPRLPRDEVHVLLDGTRFEGLARWADIWEHSTGLYFLDASSEDAWSDAIDWSMENVQALARDWQRSEVIHNQVIRLAAWLEENPSGHFGELVDFIEKRRGHRC